MWRRRGSLVDTQPARSYTHSQQGFLAFRAPTLFDWVRIGIHLTAELQRNELDSFNHQLKHFRPEILALTRHTMEAAQHKFALSENYYTWQMRRIRFQWVRNGARMVEKFWNLD